MRRAILICMVLLAAILTGALAAGTPVAGNDSVAAVTAGINLGTSPTPRVASASPTHNASPANLRPLLVLLRLLIVAGTVSVALGQAKSPSLRSLLHWRAVGQRGPPALA